MSTAWSAPKAVPSSSHPLAPVPFDRAPPSPLLRRSLAPQGYAIIEYATYEEAQAAVEKGNGQQINGLPVAVDWAFLSGKQ